MTTTSPASQQRFRRDLGLVVAASLAGRIAFVVLGRRDTALAGDDYFYHWQARAIAEGRGFIDPLVWQGLGREIPTSGHPPLYSTYLAAWSALGVDTPLGHRLVSCLLGAAAVLVVGLAAQRLAGDRAGIAAAVLAAVSPSLWVNDGGLISESLYALTVALVLLAGVGLWSAPSPRRAALLGASVAAAAFTRGEAQLLLPVLGVAILLTAGWSRRQRVVTVGITLGTVAVLVAPWTAYNLRTFEEPVLISTGIGSVLRAANCDDTYGGRLLGYWSFDCIVGDRPPITDEQRSQLEAAGVPPIVYLADQGVDDPSVADRIDREVGLAYVRDHAARAPVVAAARVGRVTGVFRAGDTAEFDQFFERRGRWPSRLAFVGLFVAAPLAIAGARVLRARRRPLWPAAAVALVTAVTAAVSIGIPRYRLGLDVVVLVLAGVGIDAVLRARAAGAPTRDATGRGPR